MTVAVIPAGGAGTRLWPRSRRSTPKHVLPLGESGRPLLRETYDRASKLASEVFVLTETGQREIIQKVLPEIDAAHLILEPSARGTTNAPPNTRGNPRGRAAGHGDGSGGSAGR